MDVYRSYWYSSRYIDVGIPYITIVVKLNSCCSGVSMLVTIPIMYSAIIILLSQ